MTTSHPRQPAGFSLAEVTIAVAIAALGLISLLGLLPQGIEMARRTGEMGARRQITEQITRDLEQASWTDLQTMVGKGTGQTRFFDDQGIETNSGSLNVSYVVNVFVHDLDARLPQGGGGDDGTAQKYLRRAVVKVATSSNPMFDFSDKNRARYATFYTYVAKIR